MKTYQAALIAACCCWFHTTFAARIPEVLSNTTGLTRLEGLLETTGLADVLEGEGPFTVFAPKNGAFLMLPGDIKMLLSDPDQTDAVTDILLFHVVENMAITSSDLSLGAMVEAANGEILEVLSLDPVTINDAIVTTADIMADNGVIHIVDTVLLPPPALIVASPSPNATFPPSNATSLPPEATTLPETTAPPETTTPLETSPPTASPVPETSAPTVAGPKIPETASATPGLSTFLNLLRSTGLEETLNGDGPFTVFAPNNAAFGNLPGELKTALNDPEQQAAVADILLYHVVSDAVILSMDLAPGATVVAANGHILEVTSVNPPTINTDSAVVISDILADNGVIHVIDTVLLPPAPTAPPGTTIPEVIARTPGLSTFLNLLEMIGLADTLSEGGPFTVFAPNNGAFLQLPADSKVNVNNATTVEDTLFDHVVADAIIRSSDLTLGATVTTLNGNTLEVTSLNPPTINDSVVVRADIEAFNGVIHVIDKVL